MQYIKFFNQISKEDVAVAGGKGASLGEMTRVGIPVPPGFVLLANAFDTFLTEADIAVEIAAVLDTVNTTEMHTVEHASEKIQALILQAVMPQDIASEIMEAYEFLSRSVIPTESSSGGISPFRKASSRDDNRQASDNLLVAVRSSATAEDSASAAWAGQLDSFLNTTKETLLQNVQKCWASLFTPRAIFYRFEKKLHTQQVSVAVVVQAMVQSEVSGIAFSVHPVTQDRGQLIIEAGFGLGEAIVSGQVTPDSYVVTKHPLAIVDKNIFSQDHMLVRSADGGNEWIEINHRYTDDEGNADTSSVIPDKPRLGKVRSGIQSFDESGSRLGGRDGKTNDQQKLSDAQILELSQLIIKIENHYGFPCDIEWAWASNQFYITQSRPITTLVPNSGGGFIPFDITSNEYVLTFKASGVSVLYADMVNTMYLPYDPLIYIYQGKYYQYLRVEQFNRAGGEGVRLFSDKNLYEAYVKELEAVATHFETFCERYRQSNGPLEKSIVQEFIDYSEKFHRLYSRMGFEHTDKAFLLQYENEVVCDNLEHLSVFKDQIRARLNKIYFEEGNFFSFMLVRLGAQFQINPHKLESYTQSELVSLFDGRAVLEQELASRARGFAVQSIQGSTYYATGAVVASVYESLEKNVDVKTDSLQGVVAHKGYATGVVRKVSVDYSDFEKLAIAMDKMEMGQILVAETTAPELMGAIRKAAAIITDQGGLMSHAAIVSRELNIPCIVGTQIATHILHDGDLVEVDANTGVVRVIEKAK